jgi:hypothetical protein
VLIRWVATMIARPKQSSWQPARVTPVAALRSFAVIVAVLGVLFLALDFSVNGVFSSWLFELAVVQPVEARYGFDAEWQSVGGMAHLVIRSVVPGGRFDRAGVQVGHAFSPARCGWFALGGGWYALLGNATGPTSVVIETVAGDVRTERTFAVR